jgi:hypothetical protein
VNPIFSDETLPRTERQIDGRKHRYSQTKAGALVVVVVAEVVALNARDLDVEDVVAWPREQRWSRLLSHSVPMSDTVMQLCISVDWSDIMIIYWTCWSAAKGTRDSGISLCPPILIVPTSTVRGVIGRRSCRSRVFIGGSTDDRRLRLGGKFSPRDDHHPTLKGAAHVISLVMQDAVSFAAPADS